MFVGCYRPDRVWRVAPGGTPEILLATSGGRGPERTGERRVPGTSAGPPRYLKPRRLEPGLVLGGYRRSPVAGSQAGRVPARSTGRLSLSTFEWQHRRSLGGRPSRPHSRAPWVTSWRRQPALRGEAISLPFVGDSNPMVKQVGPTGTGRSYGTKSGSPIEARPMSSSCPRACRPTSRWFLARSCGSFLGYGRYTRAAILHDYLWRFRVGNATDPVSRRDADRLLRRVMRELGVPFLRRWIMWTAVRWAGLTKPDGRRQWLRDAPQVLLVTVVALPFLLSSPRAARAGRIGGVLCARTADGVRPEGGPVRQEGGHQGGATQGGVGADVRVEHQKTQQGGVMERHGPRATSSSARGCSGRASEGGSRPRGVA